MKEPEKVKLTQAEGEALIERIKASDLTESDRRVLERLIHRYFWLLFTLQEAKLSLKRLKELLFGKSRKTEAQDNSPNDGPPGPAGNPPGKPDTPSGDDGPARDEAERDAAGRRQRGGGKPAGQGRQSAEAYPGAERVLCQLEALAVGQRCPACGQGSLYRLPPGVEVRIDGNGFLTARRYELEKLRCSAGGQVDTAPLPSEAGQEKYTDRARAVRQRDAITWGCRLTGWKAINGWWACRWPMPLSGIRSSGWPVIAGRCLTN